MLARLLGLVGLSLAWLLFDYERIESVSICACSSECNISSRWLERVGVTLGLVFAF